MTKIIELADKKIKADVINISLMFRKVKKNGHYEKRRKIQIEKRPKLNS